MIQNTKWGGTSPFSPIVLFMAFSSTSYVALGDMDGISSIISLKYLRRVLAKFH